MQTDSQAFRRAQRVEGPHTNRGASRQKDGGSAGQKELRAPSLPGVHGVYYACSQPGVIAPESERGACTQSVRHAGANTEG
eukprot:4398729-Pleurochrysis_carterae.AAC.2